MFFCREQGNQAGNSEGDVDANSPSRPDGTSQSVTLTLSAVMLQSLWNRTRAEFPELGLDEVERRMYGKLHDIERGQNRIDRRWLKLMLKASRRKDC